MPVRQIQQRERASGALVVPLEEMQDPGSDVGYLRPDRFVEETHLFTFPTKFVRIPSSLTDDRLACTIRAILSPRVLSAGPEGG